MSESGRIFRRHSYRGQAVTVTDRASGDVVDGILKGWGPVILQLWVGDLGDEGYREFATGLITVTSR